jgi:hypothetical protein
VLLIYTKERKRHVRDAALNDARTIAPIHSGVIVQGPAFIAIRYWMMGMHTPRHISFCRCDRVFLEVVVYSKSWGEMS